MLQYVSKPKRMSIFSAKFKSKNYKISVYISKQQWISNCQFFYIMMGVVPIKSYDKDYPHQWNILWYSKKGWSIINEYILFKFGYFYFDHFQRFTEEEFH